MAQTCQRKHCPLDAETTALGNQYCEYHAYRIEKHSNEERTYSPPPETVLVGDRRYDTSDGKRRIYPFGDDDGTIDYQGLAVFYDGVFFNIWEEYDYEDPYRGDVHLSIEPDELPAVIEALVEDAPHELHDEIRDRVDAGLERAPLDTEQFVER